MGDKSFAAAPMADMAVGKSATAARDSGSTTSGPTASVAASSSVSTSMGELELVEVQGVGGRDVDPTNAGGEEEEESVEDLLSSLMRTLNTEQGRVDFRLLASGATS